MERDIRPHADDAIFLQRAAHPQNGLRARVSPQTINLAIIGS
ncbi:MAG: hypothetical protein U0X92_18710 [Anaerolineales bacterium]